MLFSVDNPKLIIEFFQFLLNRKIDAAMNPGRFPRAFSDERGFDSVNRINLAAHNTAFVTHNKLLERKDTGIDNLGFNSDVIADGKTAVPEKLCFHIAADF